MIELFTLSVAQRMSFHKELSSERLPLQEGLDLASREDDSLIIPSSDIRNMSEEELTEKLEVVLLDRIKTGDNLALFQLGQLYYEQVKYLENNQHLYILLIVLTLQTPFHVLASFKMVN